MGERDDDVAKIRDEWRAFLGPETLAEWDQVEDIEAELRPRIDPAAADRKRIAGELRAMLERFEDYGWQCAEHDLKAFAAKLEGE